MRRIILILAVMASSFPALAQTGVLPVYACTLPGTQAQTSGLKSSNYLMGVIPSCTVSVYLTGTTTLATTSPQSPFTANIDGSIPPIYASPRQAYDVVLSGGIAPNTYSSPVTLTDVSTAAGSTAAGSTLPKSVTDFGAVGNGSTDDYIALSAALTYAKANNACIYFPKGAYMTSTQLVWNSSVPLCLIGEQSTTSYIDYNGGAVSGGGLDVHNTTTPGNGYYSNVTLRNIGFASNTSAQSALHLWRTVGTVDTLDFSGGSVSSLQCDDCNLQEDARNLRVSPAIYFPAITGSTCVNGLTFADDGTYPSGAFSMESPVVQSCAGTGLNLSNAAAITINGGQIAGNHRQLYQNCTVACNNGGNTFNGTLFEGLGGTVSITACAVDSSNHAVLTATNTLSAGQSVLIYGFSSTVIGGPCGFLNGTQAAVLSTGLSSSQFEINFTHTTLSTQTNNGTADPKFVANEIHGPGNTFTNVNFGAIPLLVYSSYNTFNGQSLINPYVQAGATGNVFENTFIWVDSVDGGTATQGFGNTYLQFSTLSSMFNNLQTTDLTVTNKINNYTLCVPPGINNLILGRGALPCSMTGNYNVIVGPTALGNITFPGTMVYDTAMGFSALYSDDGSYNTAFGAFAGKNISGGVLPNTGGDHEDFFGEQTSPLGANDTNEGVYGNGTTGHGSNTVTIGNSSVTDTYLAGAVHVTSCVGCTGGTPAYVVSSGAIPVVSTNTYVTCTTTCTVTPLAPAAGTQLCVDNAPGSATVITLAALGTGKYYSLIDNSAYGTANHTVVSGGAVTDSICIVGLDATHYKVKSSTGPWTD